MIAEGRYILSLTRRCVLCLQNVGGLPEYQSLLDEMVAEDPLARPTMSEALCRARELRLTLPEDL